MAGFFSSIFDISRTGCKALSKYCDADAFLINIIFIPRVEGASSQFHLETVQGGTQGICDGSSSASVTQIPETIVPAL